MKHHLILNIVIASASYILTRISASFLMLIFLQLNLTKLKFTSLSIAINNKRTNAMYYKLRSFASILNSVCSSVLESLLNYVSIVPGSNKNISAIHNVFVFPEMLACFNIKFSSFKTLICFSIGH